VDKKYTMTFGMMGVLLERRVYKTWNEIYPKYEYEQNAQNNFWVHVFTPTNHSQQTV